MKHYQAAAIAAVLVGLSVVPVALALTTPITEWAEDEYRRCQAEAIDEEMGRRIDAYRQFHDEYMQDLEDYRSALSQAWEESDERTRETKRRLDDALRESKNELRERQVECRQRRSDHRSFARDLCTSSDQCQSNRVCSTEFGDCESSCPPDADFCVQVCAGRCVRPNSSSSVDNQPSSRSSDQSSSRSSRFSAGFSQSSYSRFYFSRYSKSSRSSYGYCQPYQCPDGRQFPSCTADGHPINYFQNPCNS